MKRGDNLQPEGEFQKRPDQEWAPGERANIVKRDDNLQPEGEFQKRPDQKWAPGNVFIKAVNLKNKITCYNPFE